jgi:hypothetical protein
MTNKRRRKDSFELGLETTESWINRTWRPAAAVVYLVICLFDFIIAPAFMGFKSTNVAQMAGALKDLDPTVAMAMIQNRTPWQPLTLQGSGLFHIAFGAILGVTAWTRGTAQIEQIRQTGESDRSPYTPTAVTTYLPPAYNNQQAGTAPTSPVAPVAPAMQVTVNNTGPVDSPDVEPDKY